ncbi:B12-binding domain-containing radical SAM protein, partial [Planctomycetota bacterium]
RRSASDLFLENGIWILKRYLGGKGHTVEPLDLATNSFYRSINPGFISKLSRKIYGKLFSGKKKKPGIKEKLLFGAGMLIQWLSKKIRYTRMRKKLRQIAEEAAHRGDRIFGIKVWYGEAFTWAQELCRLIHDKSPETIVIAGGFHPTLYEQDFMEESSFDIAVTGEGEQPLTAILDIIDTYKHAWDRETVLQEIAETIKQGNLSNTLIEDPQRKGEYLHARKHPEIIEKAIPEYPKERQEKMGVHILVDSLGCAWGKCSFCVHSKFFEKMAPRQVERVVDEIEEMVKQGIGLFRFSGSDTYPSFGSLIGEEILKRGLNIEYSIGARASTGTKTDITYERVVSQYETMIKSGMRAVFIGGETGNNWINEHVMNKGVKTEDIIWTIQAMREAEKRAGKKIYISLALIYPAPTLGKVSLDEIYADNIHLVKQSMPDAVMVTPPAPFKQTPWYKEREKYGFILGKDFVKKLMTYEYVMYKPVSLWEELECELEGKKFKELMRECGRMRKGIEELGIETDVSDEHFLMQIASGYESNPQEFKKESLLDIISGDYEWLEEVGRKVNTYSSRLADERHPLPVYVAPVYSLQDNIV